jgi:hypothetical protein
LIDVGLPAFLGTTAISVVKVVPTVHDETVFFPGTKTGDATGNLNVQDWTSPSVGPNENLKVRKIDARAPHIGGDDLLNNSRRKTL